MNWSFVKKVLPWIGTAVEIAVPGPLGMAAAALTKGLSTPKPVSSTVDSITNAIEQAMANPDQLAKLKQIDDDFALQMATLNVNTLEDLEKLAVDDRANARARELGVRDLTPRIFGGVILAAFVAAVFFIFSGRAKVESALAGTLVGYLSAKAELVLTYYFGSSAGSDRKTELLAQNQKQ